MTAHYWFDVATHFGGWLFYQSPDHCLWAVHPAAGETYSLAERHRHAGYFLDRYRDAALEYGQILPEGLVPLRGSDLELTALAFYRALPGRSTNDRS